MTTETQKNFILVTFLKFWLVPILLSVGFFSYTHVVGSLPGFGSDVSFLVYIFVPFFIWLGALFLLLSDKFTFISEELKETILANVSASFCLYAVAGVLLSLTGEAYDIEADSNNLYYNSKTMEIVTYEPGQIVFVSEDIEKVSDHISVRDYTKDISQNLGFAIRFDGRVADSQFISDNIKKWRIKDVYEKIAKGVLVTMGYQKFHRNEVNSAICSQFKAVGYNTEHCGFELYTYGVDVQTLN